MRSLLLCTAASTRTVRLGSLSDSASGVVIVSVIGKTMLSRVVKEHQAKQVFHRDQQELKRRAAMQSATSVSEAVVDMVNSGVEEAYSNEKKLEAEAKRLHANSEMFVRQTRQWLSLVDGFNQALKEIGDVENWARSIERDMRCIAGALEYAYKGKGGTAATVQPPASS